MKTTQLIVFILITVCSFSLWSCKDKDPDPQPAPPSPNVKEEQLPPITTTGAGTFGCKVNGKVWVAKSNKTGWPPTYASVDKSNNRLINISGSMLKHPSIFHIIGLQFYYLINKSNFKLNILTDTVPSANYIDTDKNKFWRTDSILGGEVTLINFDTVKQIISGTFYFDCVNKETNDTLRITDGRFDMNYTY
ncbi:MAG: DUF6252 family protein [Bacteroidia bacterium]|jgi:hypothetical protein|nr:DUF6252 family protein [Bacteroidia bacterium]